MLLSNWYRDFLAPQHLDDLRASGLTNETIQAHRIRSVPPWMISGLLGFEASFVDSALIFPFLAPSGKLMRHIRMKVFKSPVLGKSGAKYLQPRKVSPRLYFTLAARADLDTQRALWLVEGEKKALAIAQLGLPAVGFCGIHGWHRGRDRDLLPDFNAIGLRDRIVELVPDGDWTTNSAVKKGAMGLALALRARGARVRLVNLPTEVKRGQSRR